MRALRERFLPTTHAYLKIFYFINWLVFPYFAYFYFTKYYENFDYDGFAFLIIVGYRTTLLVVIFSLFHIFDDWKNRKF